MLISLANKMWPKWALYILILYPFAAPLYCLANLRVWFIIYRSRHKLYFMGVWLCLTGMCLLLTLKMTHNSSNWKWCGVFELKNISTIINSMINFNFICFRLLLHQCLGSCWSSEAISPFHQSSRRICPWCTNIPWIWPKSKTWAWIWL